MSMVYPLPYSAWANDSTEGTSALSGIVKTLTGSIVNDFRSAQSMDDGRNDVLEKLTAMAETCSEPGWDGYEADIVAPHTLHNARAFVGTLPQGIAMPTVGAEADGQLTLEWYHSPHWVLSVSVSPENDLHYAAILGPRRVHGREPFLGQVPSGILQWIKSFSCYESPASIR